MAHCSTMKPTSGLSLDYSRAVLGLRTGPLVGPFFFFFVRFVQKHQISEEIQFLLLYDNHSALVASLPISTALS